MWTPWSAYVSLNNNPSQSFVEDGLLKEVTQHKQIQRLKEFNTNLYEYSKDKA